MPSHKFRLVISEDFTVYENLDTKETLKVPTSSLANLFYNTSNAKKNDSLLPPVVRFISSSQDAFIIERPPLPVEVYFIGSEKFTYKLYLPWTIYVFKFNDSSLSALESAKVFCRKSPITLGDNELYMFPLNSNELNCATGAVKINQFGMDLSQYSPGALLQALVQAIWDRNFSCEGMTVNDIALGMAPDFCSVPYVKAADVGSQAAYFDATVDRLAEGWNEYGAFENTNLLPALDADGKPITVNSCIEELNDASVVEDIKKMLEANTFTGMILTMMQQLTKQNVG